MPYIEKYNQEHYAPHCPTADSAGQLNYQFTVLAIKYIEKHGLRYANINDVIGALEGAKLEFYRRVASPYESKKIEENGDVY